MIRPMGLLAESAVEPYLVGMRKPTPDEKKGYILMAGLALIVLVWILFP
jgi:hypothetical protein